jgi:hypothetical protein
MAGPQYRGTGQALRAVPGESNLRPTTPRPIEITSLSDRKRSQLKSPVLSGGEERFDGFVAENDEGGGDTPIVSVSLIGNNAHFANIYQAVTLSGYLLDCTAIPCAPIAQ